MANNRVRDMNSAKLGKNQKTKKPKQEAPAPVAVTHANAPLLTVKILELILLEVRKLNTSIEEAKKEA